MASELIATPNIPTVIIAKTIDSIPPGTSLNPIFDWAPIMDIPIWIPISFIFILILVLPSIYWLMRISKLSSVKGWAESLRKMSQDDVQVWVISRVKKLTIECMTIKDNILSSHDPTNIAMYHVNSDAGVVRVGGASAVVVSEDFDQNRDFLTEIALCYACDEFNMNQEQLRNSLNEVNRKNIEKGLVPVNNKPIVVQPIEDCEAYEMYGRKCLQVINPEGLKIPSYSMFDPSKFRKYFPRGCSSMWFGGELIHDARKLNLRRKAKSFLEVHAFLIMSFGIAIISIMAAWLFPLGGK